MYEKSLKTLPLNDICAIMIRAIQDYLILEKLQQNKDDLESKRSQLYILHKLIIDKKAEILQLKK